MAERAGRVSIEWNESWFVDTLTSGPVEALMQQKAQAVAATARGMAPVGKTGAPQCDTHPGQYRDSINVEVVHGSKRSRVKVTSDVPYAMNIERRLRVLGNALRAHQIGA